MQKDPLPAEFVAWIKSLVLSGKFTDPRRLYRGLILRWGFWLDGASPNKLPGYATCPKPTERSGLPAGWSYQKIHAIAREAIGTAAIHATRKAAAHYHNCGSGQDYGICRACGQAHGHTLMKNGVSTTLVSSTAH